MAEVACTGTLLEDRIDANIQRMQSKQSGNLEDLRKHWESYPDGAGQAFDDFFHGKCSSTEHLIRREASWNNESALEATVQLVDEVYFHGRVRRTVPVRFATIDGGTLGHTMERKEKNTREIWIEIDMGMHKNFWTFFATLAHEMAHAYVKLYQCQSLSKECQSRQKRIYQVGLTGHGAYWQRLALAIEELTKEIRGRKMVLGRWTAATVELLEAVNEDDVVLYLRASFDVKQGDDILCIWRQFRAGSLEGDT